VKLDPCLAASDGARGRVFFSRTNSCLFFGRFFTLATAVETLGKLERRITISFPLTDVRTEVEKRLKVQARTAKAPGFRPGKVPLKMVAAQYGYQIESEVLNDKVGRAFNDAANENNLRVAGFPNIVPKERSGRRPAGFRCNVRSVSGSRHRRPDGC